MKSLSSGFTSCGILPQHPTHFFAHHKVSNGGIQNIPFEIKFLNPIELVWCAACPEGLGFGFVAGFCEKGSGGG
jgi:hypothetical protein